MSLDTTDDITYTTEVNPSEFIAFCDGLYEAGFEDYALRGRMIARELVESRERVVALVHTVARLRGERDEWRDKAFLAKHGQPWPT